MNNIQKDWAVNETHRDVEKLMQKLAWAASARYGITFEEALSEANWCFVRSYNWRYDRKKGTSFATFLYQNITFRFRTMWRRGTRADLRMPTVELNEEICGAAPPQSSPCLEILESLSEDAQEIVSLLLETPAEVLGELRPVRSPQRLLQRVKRHLRKQGRSKEQVDAAHAEIQAAFRQVWAN